MNMTLPVQWFLEGLVGYTGWSQREAWLGWSGEVKDQEGTEVWGSVRVIGRLQSYVMTEQRQRNVLCSKF